MKKITIFLFALSLSLFTSCKDYLDIVPDGTASMETAFSNRINAEKFLHTCYSYLPSPCAAGGSPAIFGNDEMTFDITNLQTPGSWDKNFEIQEGRQVPDNVVFNYWDGGNGGSNLWIGIRDCNIFLDNITTPPDLEEEERDRWIAEVTFLKAYYHFYLFRMYGPIPIMDDDLDVGSGVEAVRVYRDPVDDVVEYIVSTIDKALPNLYEKVENNTEETGRITKSVALSFKAEVLALAASPLFNGNPLYTNYKDSRGVQLFPQEYDENKWKLAADAAKAAIDEATDINKGGHSLYTYSSASFAQLTEYTKQLITIQLAVTERRDRNKEIIFSTDDSSVELQRNSLPALDAEEQSIRDAWSCASVNMAVAEEYYTSNGVPMNEDKSAWWLDHYESRYDMYAGIDAISDKGEDNSLVLMIGDTTATLNLNREPRFYANLAFDRGKWWYDDLMTDENGGITLKVRKGEPSNTGLSHRNLTGYYPKKFNGIYSYIFDGTVVTYRYSFPIVRLAGLYLLYAECLNETLESPSAEVYEYVDMVRERAGLAGVVDSWRNFSSNPTKPAIKSGMREIIRQERLNELSLEGQRLWDKRRWLMEPSTFYGYYTYGTNATDYYRRYECLPRDNRYSYKEYLWPLSTDAIQRNPNFVQNPGW